MHVGIDKYTCPAHTSSTFHYPLLDITSHYADKLALVMYHSITIIIILILINQWFTRFLTWSHGNHMLDQNIMY